MLTKASVEMVEEVFVVGCHNKENPKRMVFNSRSHALGMGIKDERLSDEQQFAVFG